MGLVICPKCGTQAFAELVFCHKCGARLALPENVSTFYDTEKIDEQPANSNEPSGDTSDFWRDAWSHRPRTFAGVALALVGSFIILLVGIGVLLVGATLYGDWLGLGLLGSLLLALITIPLVPWVAAIATGNFWLLPVPYAIGGLGNWLFGRAWGFMRASQMIDQSQAREESGQGKGMRQPTPQKLTIREIILSGPLGLCVLVTLLSICSMFMPTSDYSYSPENVQSRLQFFHILGVGWAVAIPLYVVEWLLTRTFTPWSFLGFWWLSNPPDSTHGRNRRVSLIWVYLVPLGLCIRAGRILYKVCERVHQWFIVRNQEWLSFALLLLVLLSGISLLVVLSVHPQLHQSVIDPATQLEMVEAEWQRWDMHEARLTLGERIMEHSVSDLVILSVFCLMCWTIYRLFRSLASKIGDWPTLAIFFLISFLVLLAFQPGSPLSRMLDSYVITITVDAIPPPLSPYTEPAQTIDGLFFSGGGLILFGFPFYKVMLNTEERQADPQSKWSADLATEEAEEDESGEG